MGDIGSTDTWTIKLTLSNLEGDLPTCREVQELVEAQMEGVLDEQGLQCIGVEVVS